MNDGTPMLIRKSVKRNIAANDVRRRRIFLWFFGKSDIDQLVFSAV